MFGVTGQTARKTPPTQTDYPMTLITIPVRSFG